jgi:hypothetical protein
VGSVPTAQQSEADAQEIPASGPVPLGRVWVIQLLPPFVVASTTPYVPVGSDPTAQQSVDDVHELPARGPVSLVRLSTLHVLPPVPVVAEIP